MTASRGKGQMGQSGRSAGERDCKTPDPSSCDVVLFVQLLSVVNALAQDCQRKHLLHGSGAGCLAFVPFF